MRICVPLSLCAPLLLLATCVVQAQDPEFKAEVVLDGLDNPCGVAIQPETGDVFVSDSGGKRIIRVKDGKATDVIVDFPLDVYGKGPMYNVGPLGLLFLDKNTLVVGGGGKVDGEELLRVYAIPDEGAEPIKAEEAMKQSFKLEAMGEVKGEGNFYALARIEDAIFVTANGDDTKGWVARATLKNANEVDTFERFLATKEATQVDAPVGITVSPQKYLVVGQMGEINVPGDSLLTFYDAPKKEVLLNIQTGLSDIAAVAYSTQKRGEKEQLYVLDFSWHDTTQGGLFRIVAKDKDNPDKVTPRKIVELDKPTAMVFGADGTLYITVLGTAPEGSDKKPGQLLKINPGL